VVDPITAKDPSERQWVDDHRFMMQAKRIMRRYQNSLVLVTHPPKTLSREKRNTAWGDDVAGGMAYQNFSQTILWLEYLAHSEETSCSTPQGAVMQHINRKIQIRKARSKEGQGYTIGFFFNGGTVMFEERGLVDA
jgi:ERCC4-type nuclease